MNQAQRLGVCVQISGGWVESEKSPHVEGGGI